MGWCVHSIMNVIFEVIILFLETFYLIIKNIFLTNNTSKKYFELYRED